MFWTLCLTLVLTLTILYCKKCCWKPWSANWLPRNLIRNFNHMGFLQGKWYPRCWFEAKSNYALHCSPQWNNGLQNFGLVHKISKRPYYLQQSLHDVLHPETHSRKTMIARRGCCLGLLFLALKYIRKLFSFVDYGCHGWFCFRMADFFFLPRCLLSCSKASLLEV